MLDCEGVINTMKYIILHIYLLTTVEWELKMMQRREIGWVVDVHDL